MECTRAGSKCVCGPLYGRAFAERCVSEQRVCLLFGRATKTDNVQGRCRTDVNSNVTVEDDCSHCCIKYPLPKQFQNRLIPFRSLERESVLKNASNSCALVRLSGSAEVSADDSDVFFDSSSDLTSRVVTGGRATCRGATGT